MGETDQLFDVEDTVEMSASEVRQLLALAQRPVVELTEDDLKPVMIYTELESFSLDAPPLCRTEPMIDAAPGRSGMAIAAALVMFAACVGMFAGALAG